MLTAMEVLNPEQLRVLGSLVEKAATTPEQYPLTLNALTLACNQASNRNPVVSYDQSTVLEAVGGLRQMGLARVVHSPSNRADKYRHVLDEAWGLTAGEVAVLGVLALRGPQTVSELRSRTERYPGMEDMGGVEGILHRLRNRYEEPYVTRLERQPGQREERWAHLLAGEVIEVPQAPVPRGWGNGAGSAPTNTERVATLEAQVGNLLAEVAKLRSEVLSLHRALDELRSILE